MELRVNSGTPEGFLKPHYQSDVFVHGFAGQAPAFMRQYDLMVPLLRRWHAHQNHQRKAWPWARPCLAPLGAENIAVHDGRSALTRCRVADGPCGGRDGEVSTAQIGAAASQTACARLTAAHVTQRFLDLYEQLRSVPTHADGVACYLRPAAGGLHPCCFRCCWGGWRAASSQGRCAARPTNGQPWMLLAALRDCRSATPPPIRSTACG
jgi:hypothetical protein